MEEIHLVELPLQHVEVAAQTFEVEIMRSKILEIDSREISTVSCRFSEFDGTCL